MGRTAQHLEPTIREPCRQLFAACLDVRDIEVATQDPYGNGDLIESAPTRLGFDNATKRWRRQSDRVHCQEQGAGRSAYAPLVCQWSIEPECGLRSIHLIEIA